MLAIAVRGAQAALDCAGWNTEEYFQTATVEDVTACLDAGAAARTDDYRITPLHWAAGGKGNPAVVEVLIKAGADVAALAAAGLTSLHFAALNNGNPAVIEALLAAGADVAVRNDSGATPLHRAAQRNENPAVIELLLNAGASARARNISGEMPLHSAAELVSDFGGLHGGDAIEALLDAGANPAARNAAGETPWDLAEENEALKGSDAYWRLNDARFDAPGPGAHRAPTTSSDRQQVATAPPPLRQGPACEIPGYPTLSNVQTQGLSWCGSNVGFQRRAFALQAAGAQCAIATGSFSTPEQINARRQEINASCDTLDAMQSPDIPTCQCPAGLRP